MKKLFAIGEALIDMIPNAAGCGIGEVTAFSPAIGGAPANVCAAYTLLGGESELITQLGNDPFGHRIAKELSAVGVGLSHVLFTDRANTALAFVSLKADGDREFSFYRNPSADLLLSPRQIRAAWFCEAFALHFCSVSLQESPMKQAHRKAIELAERAGALISFDPNLRFPLWKDHECLRSTVLEFLPQAHVLKVSLEELPFISGIADDREAAVASLFTGRVGLVLLTCGADGAHAYTRAAHAFDPGARVQATDTTGAGDLFIGSFLHSLAAAGVTPGNLADLGAGELEKMLRFSNTCCQFSVTSSGAIASYPTAEIAARLMKARN